MFPEPTPALDIDARGKARILLVLIATMLARNNQEPREKIKTLIVEICRVMNWTRLQIEYPSVEPFFVDLRVPKKSCWNA